MPTVCFGTLYNLILNILAMKKKKKNFHHKVGTVMRLTFGQAGCIREALYLGSVTHCSGHYFSCTLPTKQDTRVINKNKIKRQKKNNRLYCTG